jgi:hypothetical protein
MLESKETWKVQDATKIQTFMRCPRKYFFEYVLGWKSTNPSVHLVFGEAWHLAMEKLLIDGYSMENTVEAYKLFEECYREQFPPIMDPSNGVKIPSNALRALFLYIDHFEHDNFEVLWTEIAGSVLVGENRVVHFKMDTIAKDKDGKIFSLEHKTSTRFSVQWADQWRQKMQVGVYSHVLHCLYSKGDILGIKINGAFITNPPRMKKDGTPYANDNDCTFVRVPIQKSMLAMEDWLVQVNSWLDRIDGEFRQLEKSSPSNSVLKAFPKQTEACTDYGGCPFRDYCSAWPNPLRHLDNPPAGFKEEHWDPRKNVEKAKKVINL